MAAILAEVKSRLLLPKRQDAEEDEEDPRAELDSVGLREYEAIKHAAEEIGPASTAIGTGLCFRPLAVHLMKPLSR